MRTYCSWIPNVLGRLSFSISGLGSHPSRVVFESNLRDGGRYFVGFQRRDLSDTTIPLLTRFKFFKRLIDKYFLGKTGDFYFVCLMKKSENSEYIKGRIFVIDRVDWLPIRAEFREKMNSVNYYTKVDTVLYDEFVDILESTKVFFDAKFKLERNGIVEISLNAKVEPEYFENKESFDADHACAAQVFFFLRDLFHTHKFHSPNTDTILDVYPKKDGWMKSVDYALARKAIALRRQNTQLSLYKCVGIIAYLRSFQKNIIQSDTSVISDFSTAEFVQATKASRRIVEIANSHSWFSILNSFKNEFIKWASIAATLAAIFVDKDTISNSDFLSSSIFAYVSNLSKIQILLVILVMSGTVISSLKLLVDSSNRHRDEFAASLVTTTMPINRDLTVGILFTISLSILVLSFYILHFVFIRILSGT